MKQASAQIISFKATPVTIGTWTILKLPAEASAKLPSRGQVMVEGSINGQPFQTPLEPDGRWSHWFELDANLLAATGAQKPLELTMTPTKSWPEPNIPKDLQAALKATPKAQELWRQITPMARWEWIRWTRSTPNSETRKKRIEVACSKLTAGTRRPCCWNRNLCTQPEVSKNGFLLDPEPAQ